MTSLRLQTIASEILALTTAGLGSTNMDVQEPIVGIQIDDLIKLRGRREKSISPIQQFITLGK